MVIHWFPHEIAYKCKGKCKVNNESYRWNKIYKKITNESWK